MPALLILPFVDRARRRSVLVYDFEGGLEVVFEQLTETFDRLSKCGGRWHVDAGGRLYSQHQRKRNAGADMVVSRAKTQMGYGLPRGVKSNLIPPWIMAGRQKLYFLPDVILVEDNRRFGAVHYGELRISAVRSRFIETDGVPRDADVVGQTWEHPNRDGGPDRRFGRNRRLPVCLYGELGLASESGLKEMFQFSAVGVAVDFANAVKALQPR